VDDPDLGAVEAFYAERGEPAQVQVTPSDGHPELVASLDARGWSSRWPSAVLSAPAAPVAAAGVPILRTPTPEWLAAWGRAEGRAPADVAAHARLVLAQLDGRTAYALDGGAVGLVVCEDDLAGLFCIAVEPDRRRHGLGTRIVGALAAHALAHGAAELHLEVEERNAPALALYARLGFTRRYGYVHRVAPGRGA
jgi:ribosomal protein S18 acetylase RimI-like enzyme